MTDIRFGTGDQDYDPMNALSADDHPYDGTTTELLRALDLAVVSCQRAFLAFDGVNEFIEEDGHHDFLMDAGDGWSRATEETHDLAWRSLNEAIELRNRAYRIRKLMLGMMNDRPA